MSVPRDTITIAPVIGSEKDFEAFKKKYGDKKEYFFDCGIAESVIKQIAKEFPDITFFGYITYNNSGSFASYYYINIIFNGNGLTYLGELVDTDVGISKCDIRDLKVCGLSKYGNQYDCLEAGIFESFMKSNRSTEELAGFLGVSEDDLYRVSGDYD